MSTVLKSEQFTALNYAGTGRYNYKIEVVLNSQDDVLHKSNITINTYQNKGTSGYNGNGYIWMRLHGHTSKVATDAEWVAPVKVSSNDKTNWELISALSYTADFEHDTDGTLSIRAIVNLQNQNSTSPYAPRSTDMECVATVPAFAGPTYTYLDQPEDWTTSNAGSSENGTPMVFTFTQATGVDHHTVSVSIPADGDFPALAIRTNVSCESGVPITPDPPQYGISNTRILEILDVLATRGVTKVQAAATLKSYNSSDVLLGSDTKYFMIIGSGIDVKDDGAWKNGMMWVNDDGTWKPGIVWLNVNGTWKKGIGLNE